MKKQKLDRDGDYDNNADGAPKSPPIFSSGKGKFGAAKTAMKPAPKKMGKPKNVSTSKKK